MTQRVAGVLTAAMGLLLLPGVAGAQSTVQSPSGSWELRVEAPQSKWSPKASHTVRREGAEVWSQRFDFALIKAVVTDNGVVVGVADSQHGGGPAFEVVAIEASGHLRWQHTLPRRMTRNRDWGPTPGLQQITLIESADLFIVTLGDCDADDLRRSYTEWRRFNVSDGAVQRSVRIPKEWRAVTTFSSSTPIPGTPLVIFHGLASSRPVVPTTTDSYYDSRFAVLHVDGRLVWSRAIEGDCRGHAEFNRIHDSNETAYRVADHAFLIRSSSTKEAACFEVAEDVESPTGWVVKERDCDVPGFEIAVRKVSPMPPLRDLIPNRFSGF